MCSNLIILKLEDGETVLIDPRDFQIEVKPEKQQCSNLEPCEA